MEEYRCLLPWYEDFAQKRQLSRVRKLLADKALLPMAPYEEAIVQAVRNHQAVVIAGDTGCGKSTQVRISEDISSWAVFRGVCY